MAMIVVLTPATTVTAMTTTQCSHSEHCIQVHLGNFLSEQLAAKAYDRAAINYGTSTGQPQATNFEVVNYNGELEVLKAMDQDAFVTALADEE